MMYLMGFAVIFALVINGVLMIIAMALLNDFRKIYKERMQIDKDLAETVNNINKGITGLEKTELSRKVKTPMKPGDFN